MPIHVGISGDKDISDVYAVINGSNKMVSDVYMSKDGKLLHTHNSQGEKIFTSSDTFTIPTGVKKVDIFLVGGGGGGGAGQTGNYGSAKFLGCGGGGGYTVTALGVEVISSPGYAYAITVGAGGTYGTESRGGSSSAMGYTAYGGWNGWAVNCYNCDSDTFVINTGHGGSGGGLGGIHDNINGIYYRGGGSGGSAGSNGYLWRDEAYLSTAGGKAYNGQGVGQGTSTVAFGDPNGTLYSGGGGGGTWATVSSANIAAGGYGGGGTGGWYYTSSLTYVDPNNGRDNTGGGGGGHRCNTSNPSGGNGGSGIVIVRWGYKNGAEIIQKKTKYSESEFLSLLDAGVLTKDHIGRDVVFNYCINSYFRQQVYTIVDINHYDNGSATSKTVDLEAKYAINSIGKIQLGPDSSSIYANDSNTGDLRYYLNNNYYSGFSSEVRSRMRKMSVPCYLRSKLKNVYSNYVKIASLEELGVTTDNTFNLFRPEGTAYPVHNPSDTRYCSDASHNAKKYKYYDETNSNSTPENAASYVSYWTRTCNLNSSSYVYYIGTSGAGVSYGVYAPTSAMCMVAPIISFTQNADYTKAKSILSKSRITEEEFFYCLNLNIFESSHKGKEIEFNISGVTDESNVYVIADVNHDGIYGSVDVISKYALTKKLFNISTGSNDFSSSSTAINTWLNSTYYNTFSEEARKHMCGTYYELDGTMYKNYIALPSGTEMGLSGTNMAVEGTKYPNMVSATNRMKTTVSGEAVPYWTRTKYSGSSSEVWIVSAGGTAEYMYMAASAGIVPIIRFF